MSHTAPELSRSLLIEGNIRLGKIEQAHNCEILLAVESGSRAWGFPSPDSDNDVRFFFRRPLKSYLAIDPERDVIETPMDGDWDVNGWDITKALRLMVKGNATVGEWLNSPLIYRENEKSDFSYRLRDLLAVHADPRLSARHYYGLANSCFKGEIANRPDRRQGGVSRSRGSDLQRSDARHPQEILLRRARRRRHHLGRQV
jgi:hypothetical protein